MTALVSKAMDERLPFSQRFAYKLHLLYCTSCRRYTRQLRVLRDGLRRVVAGLTEADGLPGPGLSRAARERIARAIRNR